MKFTQTALFAALVAAPVVAFGQGFEGAELSAGMMAWTEDTNLGAASYSGGLEFGVISGIGIALDISRHNWRGEDGNSTTYTLHGLYDVSPAATAGLFVAQDRRDLGNTDIYGLEGATTVSGISVEGYLGRIDGDLGTGTLLGVNGGFAFSDALSATASAGVVNLAESYTSLSLGGEYRFGSGPTVFAEIGRSDLGGDPATSVTLGARIDLGAGTTFGARGITDILPGF